MLALGFQCLILQLVGCIGYKQKIMGEKIQDKILFIQKYQEIVKQKLITKALSDARSEAKGDLYLQNPKYGFLENLQIRGDEIKIKKILAEQGGKPIIDNNFGILNNDNINNNN